MTKMSTLSIRVESELKRAFLDAVRDDGCSGAKIVRAFMQAIVDGSRNPDDLRDQVRAAVENPAPDRTPEAAFQRTRRIAADMLHLARPTWQSLTDVPKADADFLQEHPTVVGDEGTHRRLTRDALADVDAGLVIDHQTVQTWADNLSTDELLTDPDHSGQRTNEEQEWLDAPAVGREVLTPAYRTALCQTAIYLRAIFCAEIVANRF